MHESFGARMRHHREQKGVSLQTIAQQTKIQKSLLEALEKDDVTHWPAGIFRRAYVRDYAHAIGLDPDVVVREFVERFPAPIEIPEPPPLPPNRLWSLVDTALGSLRPRPRDLEASNPEPRTLNPAPANAEPPNPQPSNPRTPSRRSSDHGVRAPDLLAAARICTELGRVEHSRQVPPLLREAAGVLGAKGLIVWVWDALSEELRPAMALGYPARVLAQMGALRRDADNATAAAFRSAEACAIAGAVVVPLLTPAACAGVLAIELSSGARPAPPIMAIATILAAMLAQLIGTTDPDRRPN